MTKFKPHFIYYWVSGYRSLHGNVHGEALVYFRGCAVKDVATIRDPVLTEVTSQSHASLMTRKFTMASLVRPSSPVFGAVYGMVWYGTRMVWYGMVASMVAHPWYGMVRYDRVWYGTVWYGVVWCGIL